MSRFSSIDRFLGRREPRSTAPVSRQAPIPLALWAFAPVNAMTLVAAMALMSSNSGPEVGAFVLVLMATANSALGASIALRLRGFELRVNRRAHVRLLMQLEGTLGDARCSVYNLSLGGAGIVMSADEGQGLEGEQQFGFRVNGEELSFRAEVARVKVADGQADIALRYIEGQDTMIARLAIALLSEAGEDEVGGRSVPATRAA